jgi:hypothetical protein
MKRWLISVAILSSIVPILGCSSVRGNAPAASPALSNTHADCEVRGGIWHPGLNYCEYRTPGSSAPLGW